MDINSFIYSSGYLIKKGTFSRTSLSNVSIFLKKYILFHNATTFNLMFFFFFFMKNLPLEQLEMKVKVKRKKEKKKNAKHCLFKK